MEKLKNYIRDFFEYKEVKEQRDIQIHNFEKYKKTFCDLECNKITFYYEFQ